LDAGYEAARRVVDRHFGGEVTAHVGAGLKDYKTQLQELTSGSSTRRRRTCWSKRGGPHHEKRFVSEIAIAGRRCGRGVGRSKKTAEQAAAMEALAALSREHPEVAN
jgi:ribonuclease-3